MKHIPDKFSYLKKDDRSFKNRLGISFIVNFLFAFSLIFFTPCEMFLNNLSDFNFSFALTAMIMGGAALIYLAVSVPFSLLFKGKLFDIFVTVIFSFTLCCYIQGNFLNGNIGSLNGAAVEWHKHRVAALFGLVIWVFIFIFPFIIRYFFGRIWGKFVSFVSVLLVIMQASALVTMLFTVDFSAAVSLKYLSNNDIYNVSDKNNVVVFIVDYFDNDYADIMLADDSEAFSSLRGFTRYTNCSSAYKQTMPTIPYLLSSSEWRCETSNSDFAPVAFSKDNFLDDVAQTGAKIDIYSEGGYLSDKGMSYASNCVFNSPKVSFSGLVKGMLNYVMYRDMPIAMKAPFWFYTDDILNAAVSVSENQDESDIYIIDDAAFYRGLSESGITAVQYDTGSNFKFIHMMGGHPPYVIDENGLPTEASSEALPQFKGCFKIIYEYLDGLKKAGAYDNSTVIIMADHGHVFVEDELSSAPAPVLFVKPAGADSTQDIKISDAPVCQADFHATILKALGADESVCSKYGRTFFDTKEGEERTRYFYFRVAYDGREDEKVLEYAINGDVNDIANWHLTGNEWIWK